MKMVISHSFFYVYQLEHMRMSPILDRPSLVDSKMFST